MPRLLLVAPADAGLDLTPHGRHGDVQRFQGLRTRALALAQDSEHQVLGADVVVVEAPRLLLGEDDDSPRLVGEPFEHGALPDKAGSTAEPGLPPVCTRPLAGIACAGQAVCL